MCLAVPGKIVEISKQLVPGGSFRRGQTMARIDSRDYEIRVTAQRDALSRATLAVDPTTGETHRRHHVTA